MLTFKVQTGSRQSLKQIQQICISHVKVVLLVHSEFYYHYYRNIEYLYMAPGHTK